MCGVLILVVLFRFATIYPNCMYKSHFSWDFRCSAKEAVILLLSWNNLYVATPKCILSWFYFFFNFDFLWFTKNQRCMYKGYSFLKFFMLCKRTSEIASFVEQPVYSNFQMFSVLTLVFLFFLPLFTQNVSVKVAYSWNLRCFAQGAVILLLSWSAL